MRWRVRIPPNANQLRFCWGELAGSCPSQYISSHTAQCSKVGSIKVRLGVRIPPRANKDFEVNKSNDKHNFSSTAEVGLRVRVSPLPVHVRHIALWSIKGRVYLGEGVDSNTSQIHIKTLSTLYL